MSTWMMAYRVNWAEIDQAYGGLATSKRGELIHALEEKLEELDEQTGNTDMQDRRSRDLLTDYLDGKPCGEEESTLAWHTIETVCDHLGTCMRNDVIVPMETIATFPSVVNLMLLKRDRLGIPYEGPDVFAFLYSAFAQTKQEAPGLIDDPSELERFLEWVDSASAHQQDLLIFVY